LNLQTEAQAEVEFKEISGVNEKDIEKEENLCLIIYKCKKEHGVQ